MGQEAKLEKRRKLEVEAAGGMYLKQNGHAGIPDRLVLLPVPSEHQELVARYVKFEELKADDGKLSAIQCRVIKWLQERGYQVDVVKP
ncbi:VRR-NUC domain-containing protein [bacterium]|nr:VRR-NUC domain-containing protein [bacterium]